MTSYAPDISIAPETDVRQRAPYKRSEYNRIFKAMSQVRAATPSTARARRKAPLLCTATNHVEFRPRQDKVQVIYCHAD